jgi:hypothetical protein
MSLTKKIDSGWAMCLCGHTYRSHTTGSCTYKHQCSCKEFRERFQERCVKCSELISFLDPNVSEFRDKTKLSYVHDKCLMEPVSTNICIGCSKPITDIMDTRVQCGIREDNTKYVIGYFHSKCSSKEKKEVPISENNALKNKVAMGGLIDTPCYNCGVPFSPKDANNIAPIHQFSDPNPKYRHENCSMAGKSVRDEWEEQVRDEWEKKQLVWDRNKNKMVYKTKTDIDSILSREKTKTKYDSFAQELKDKVKESLQNQYKDFSKRENGDVLFSPSEKTVLAEILYNLGVFEIDGSIKGESKYTPEQRKVLEQLL